ncbi:MAG: hypothetical protein HYY18_19510 [Planctomycetes bacterium]|nr:hypothetical protein [Planctomycetota bacterium]
MDTDTYPREDVQKFLAGMVCIKVNPGKGKEMKKVYDSFGIRSVPTLMLIDPAGKELARSNGKPPPDQFVAAFVNPAWNAMVDAEKASDAKKMAENAFLLGTWFSDTDGGRRAVEIVSRNESNAEFKTAYDGLKSAHERASLLARGNWELKTGKKKEAIETLKGLVSSHPDSKEAGEAKATLKKLGVKPEEAPK